MIITEIVTVIEIILLIIIFLFGKTLINIFDKTFPNNRLKRYFEKSGDVK